MLVSALLALAIMSVHPLWRLTKYGITLVHEAGHAIVALLTGRDLRGISLHLDGSGLTTSAGQRGGIGMSLTSFAGYPAPALAGLAMAVMLDQGLSAQAVLMAGFVLVAVMFVFIRNVMGVLIALGAGGALALLVWQVGPSAQHFAADTLIWLLLLGSVRDVMAMAAQPRGSGSDAESLARQTGVPRGVWVVAFLAITGWCTLWAASWLLAPWLELLMSWLPSTDAAAVGG